MEKYKAAIIGTGSIGALKDDKYDYPGGPNILTHAHALWKHERTELDWVFDIDDEKMFAAEDKWNTTAMTPPFYGIPHTHYPNIVIISTPTKTHSDVLLKVLHYKPKLVIAEKPFCNDSNQAKVVVQAYKNAGVPLMVNYTRRFNPFFHPKVIRKLGQIRHCRVIYTRGFKREASHAIDLCNWWFGPALGLEILFFRQQSIIDDHSPQDITHAAHLEYDRCPHVFFSPSDGRDYNVFEIDILGSRGRIRYVDNGQRIEVSGLGDSVYGNYKTMAYPAGLVANLGGRYVRGIMRPHCQSKEQDTKLTTTLLKVVQNAVDHLDKGTPLLCTGEDALRVHQVYDRLLYSDPQTKSVNKIRAKHGYPPLPDHMVVGSLTKDDCFSGHYDPNECLCPENKTGCPIHGMLA